MATMTVLDSGGTPVAIEKPLAPARAAAAASRPVVLSNEDFAVLDGLETAIASTNTKLDTVITALGTVDGRVDGLETLGAAHSTKLDTLHTDLGGNLITKDNGPNWTSVLGVSGERFTSANQSGAAASVTDAPTSGQKLVIDDLEVAVDTAMRVDIKEETSGKVLFSRMLPANSTYGGAFRGKVKLATADKKLQVQTSASGNVYVTAIYHSEA